MKILITGFTEKQAEESPTFQFAQQSTTVRDLLTLMGHEVDLRVVVPGEDLSKYNRVLVYLLVPGAYYSRHQYGALWALASRPDALYVLDDWQVRPIAKAAQDIYRKGPQGILKTPPGLPYVEEARACVLDLHRALGELAGDGSWNRQVLMPMVRSGNPVNVPFPATKSQTVVDFTAFWLERYGKLAADLPVGPRQRRWVHASLAPEKDWIESCKFSWPVLSFGNKNEPGNRKHEVELLLYIKESWGLLSAPHPNPGLGWWRVRFSMAAACGAAVYGSHHELRKVYGTEKLWLDPARIESKTDEELSELAAAQAAALRQEMLSMSEIQERLEQFIA